MSQALPRPPATGGQKQPGQDPPMSQRPRVSWKMLLILATLLVGMYYWRSSSEASSHPAVDYSVVYSRAEADKVQSVVLKGALLEGTLKAASGATTHAIEDETRKVLAKALEDASKLLDEHRGDLERLMQRLIEHKTMDGKDLRGVLGTPTAPPGPGKPVIAAAPVVEG